MDRALGAFFDELKTRRLYDDATILVVSDHGEEFLDHGSWNHGGTLFREVVHVPLALRVPGVAARRVTAPVSLVDLAPTLLDARGVAPPPTFMGRSLLPTLRGGSARVEPIFAETELTGTRHHAISVRDGRHDYVLRLGGTGPESGSSALYDVRADPAETIDRSQDPEAARLRSLALAFLERQRAAAAPRREATIEGEAAETLRALGYIQ
jgi:arylsulfatase A-like enzyme